MKTQLTHALVPVAPFLSDSFPAHNQLETLQIEVEFRYYSLLDLGLLFHFPSWRSSPWSSLTHLVFKPWKHKMCVYAFFSWTMNYCPCSNGKLSWEIPLDPELSSWRKQTQCRWHSLLNMFPMWLPLLESMRSRRIYSVILKTEKCTYILKAWWEVGLCGFNIDSSMCLQNYRYFKYWVEMTICKLCAMKHSTRWKEKSYRYPPYSRVWTKYRDKQVIIVS